MQRSLSLVSHCRWYRAPVERSPGEWTLLTSPLWLELKTADRGSLYLRAAQNFRVIHHRGLQLPGGLFSGAKVSVTGYAYDVGVTNLGEPLLAWHWHPVVKERTHLHVYVKDEVVGALGDWHLPTSRVLFEDIVEHLIEDRGVAPLDENWRTVLAEVKANVHKTARWQGDRLPRS